MALAVMCLSAAAQVTPPIRGSFSATELSPYVEAEWNATGDAAGSARRIFDAFDGKANLRKGLVKNNLKGQMVYWEQYALNSSIIVHRADSTEAQDYFQEGSARHTGYTYKTRDTNDGISYFERTDFMDEGFVSIWNLFQSFDSDHKVAESEKSKSMCGESSIQVWYTPLKVHIKNTENVFPVYEGGTGAMDFYLSDIQDRWCIDGYTFKVTSMNTGVFTVEQPEVTTDGSGKARIRLHGVEKGKGRLRIYLNLSQPENNCYVEVEEYYDVEVLETEKWSYSMAVHDQFTLPAHDYSLSGKFSVTGTLDEDDVPRWKVLDVSPVSRSGGGSFHAQGEFINGDTREDGVVLGFDVQGILNRTEGAVGAHLGIIGEAFQYMASGQAQTTDSKNVVTAMLATLEEGSWPFRFDVKMMEQFAGSSVSGNDVFALEAAGKEIEAKRMQEQQEQQEQAKADKKKNKKKSAFREIREGLKALKELDNIEMPDLTPKNNPEESASHAYSPDQEQAKAAQVAYIKEHHCLVIPDLTQMLLPHFGNWLEEGEKSGPGGNLSWMEIHGTLTLSKEK
ncbi:MAG: hypothetical protein J6X25_00095 [Bacteroidales bacterium]|nr:hypothetical protein [Bacteroidales bacterium]